MSLRTQFRRPIPKESGFVGRVTDRVRRLGIVPGGSREFVPKVRSKDLDKYDAYVESTQYDKLQDWDAPGRGAEYVPIRQRKPRVIYDFPKRVVTTFASKMVGEDVFPRFFVDGEPALVGDENEFLKLLIKAAKFGKVMPEAMRRLATSGSVLVRFRVNDMGAIKLEVFNAKHCYPEFNDDGELVYCMIKYVYEDHADLDENRKPIEKWFRLDLGENEDILFDNPPYQQDVEPIFEPVETVAHGLGFVQGEWFRTCEDRHSIDGPSFLAGGVLSLFDEMNYSWSQSSQAISYAQEPQLAFSGMDVDGVDSLIRSSSKAWNLGRDGKAEFIEANLAGVERASAERERLRLAIQDVTRVVLHDPEKMTGTAQSGKALEQLNAPLVDLITEMRPLVEERMMSMIFKLTAITLRNISMSLPSPVNIPPGWEPTELSGLSCEWPPVFAPTQADIDMQIGTASKATSANLVSRETGMKYIADVFGVTNIEEETSKVDNQKVFNTFGGF